MALVAILHGFFDEFVDPGSELEGLMPSRNNSLMLYQISGKVSVKYNVVNSSN